MDDFKNWCVEYWLDAEGFINASTDKIQVIKNAAPSLLMAGVFACTVGQFISATNSLETARALSTVPVSEVLSRKSNANFVIKNLHEINSRIDFKLANFLDNEPFSKELSALAEKAISRLNLANTESNKTAIV